MNKFTFSEFLLNEAKYSRMKMSEKTFLALADKVEKHLKNMDMAVKNKNLPNVTNLADYYEYGYQVRAEFVKDLNRRFAMDLFGDVAHNSNNTDFIHAMYNDENLNDDQIYTAMKQIVPKLTQKYKVVDGKVVR